MKLEALSEICEERTREVVWWDLHGEGEVGNVRGGEGIAVLRDMKPHTEMIFVLSIE